MAPEVGDVGGDKRQLPHPTQHHRDSFILDEGIGVQCRERTYLTAAPGGDASPDTLLMHIFVVENYAGRWVVVAVETSASLASRIASAMASAVSSLTTDRGAITAAAGPLPVPLLLVLPPGQPWGWPAPAPRVILSFASSKHIGPYGAISTVSVTVARTSIVPGSTGVCTGAAAARVCILSAV